MDYETGKALLQKHGLTTTSLVHEINAVLGTSFDRQTAAKWFSRPKDGEVNAHVAVYLWALERTFGQLRPTPEEIRAAKNRLKLVEAQRRKKAK